LGKDYRKYFPGRGLAWDVGGPNLGDTGGEGLSPVRSTKKGNIPKRAWLGKCRAKKDAGTKGTFQVEKRRGGRIRKGREIKGIAARPPD